MPKAAEDDRAPRTNNETVSDLTTTMGNTSFMMAALATGATLMPGQSEQGSSTSPNRGAFTVDASAASPTSPVPVGPVPLVSVPPASSSSSTPPVVIPLPPRVPVIVDTPITDTYAFDPKPLGKGAQGVVHRATHKPTGKVFAIKQIDRQKIRKAESWFAAEVEGMRRLKGHSSVVQLHECYDFGGLLGLKTDPRTNEVTLEGASAGGDKERRKSSGGSSVAGTNAAATPTEVSEANAAADAEPAIPEAVKKSVFLVLEMLNGGELFECLIERGAYTELEAKEAMRAAVDALIEMHAHGVFHRDLKPENLLLTDKSDPTSVKLADFGLSFVAPHAQVPLLEFQASASALFNNSQPLTTELQAQLPLWPSSFPVPSPMTSTSSAGTFAYGSPEKLLDKGKRGYDEKVDIWALGVILFVLLSAYHPFDVDGICSPEEIQRNILAGSFSFDDPAWVHVSPLAKDLISRMLAADPRKRYSAVEVAKHPWLADKSKTSAAASALRPTIGEALARYQREMAAKMKAGMLATFAATSMMRLATTKRLSASSAGLAASAAAAAGGAGSGSSPVSSSPVGSKPSSATPSHRPSLLGTIAEGGGMVKLESEDAVTGVASGSGEGNAPATVAASPVAASPVAPALPSPLASPSARDDHDHTAATTPLSLVTTPPHKKDRELKDGEAAASSSVGGLLSPNRMQEVEEAGKALSVDVDAGRSDRNGNSSSHSGGHGADNNPLASPAVGAEKLLGARAVPSGGLVGGGEAPSSQQQQQQNPPSSSLSSALLQEDELETSQAISAISAATAATSATAASFNPASGSSGAGNGGAASTLFGAAAGVAAVPFNATGAGTTTVASGSAGAGGGAGVGIAMRAGSAHRSSTNAPSARPNSGRLLVVPDSPSAGHQGHSNNAGGVASQHAGDENLLLLLSPMSAFGSPLPSVPAGAGKASSGAVINTSRPGSGRGAPRYPGGGAVGGGATTPRPGSSHGQAVAAAGGGAAPAAAVSAAVATVVVSTPVDAPSSSDADAGGSAAPPSSSSSAASSASGEGGPGGQDAGSAIPFPALE